VLSIFPSDPRASVAGTPPFSASLAAVLSIIALALVVLPPAAHAAAPLPLITNTSFSAVTETGATLQASVDPTGGKTNAHFDYTTLAEFKAHGFEGAEAAPAEAIFVPVSVKGTGNLQAGSELITGVSVSAAGGAFGVGQTITATAIPAGTTIKTLEAEPGGETLKLKISNAATANAPAASLSATGPQPIAATLTGLQPATGYVFRAVAKKSAGAEEEAQGPATTLYTYAPPPVFGACPNDALRKGPLAPAGAPGALLPDCRSFELASPLEKNGNNALGLRGLVRAAADGSAVTFGSAFGIPGGVGAQTLPFYEAARGPGGWSTSGLLPPAGAGQRSYPLVGELPDLAATYASAVRLAGDKAETALFELHRDGSPPIQITPYTTGEKEVLFGFAGASADASTLVIEAPTALAQEESGPPIPGSAPGSPNVYAWDRAGGQLHLASVMNTAAETQEKLAKGAYAGPYNWTENSLTFEGGAIGGFYLADEHAVTADGSVFFTSRADGHLYERINPSTDQSPLDPQGNCTEPAKACTLDLSASHRTVPGPDPAGAQPAAFQAATPGGSKVFFTSSEKLTNDANTGPEQPPAQIGRATLGAGEAPVSQTKEDFLATTHALGVAIDPKGEYIYWADPSLGTIGRAKLNGETVEAIKPRFIEPGEGECLQEVKEPVLERESTTPGVFEELTIPSAPRYVAVDEGHVYWTNSGRSDGEGPLDGGGTIGRATLAGEGVEDVRPAFICGEGPPPADPSELAERLVSNPQGIAVNATDIYWANAARAGVRRLIARAAIDGGEAEMHFAEPIAGAPYGVALSATHVYITTNDGSNNGSYLERVPLAGGAGEGTFMGEAGLRGVAIDAGHLYWATQGKDGGIGRLSLGEFNEPCAAKPSCDKHFLTPEGTLTGLALSGTHLYWSVNGELPTNPGSDLYRYEPATGTLKDLVPDSSGNGAEVRGVLGTSADGSYVYFAANADLDGAGEAEAGDCKGEKFRNYVGQCNVYLYHEGQVDFVARVKTERGEPEGDDTNWNWKEVASEGNGIFQQKTARVSSDGQTLVFRSQRPLTPYDNHGTPELYRYRLGAPGIDCLTCDPTAQAPGGAVSVAFGTSTFGSISPNAQALGSVQVRFASADGDRVFFETTSALVSYDTDAADGCPAAGFYGGPPSCLDVYEWEAPGSGTCVAGGPAYSPLNQGCIYLISQGAAALSTFADASSSGDDVFFFTDAQLVGADTDNLFDVYDARVGGGLSPQNQPAARSCEGAEACKPAATQPPPVPSPPSFSGPANPKPKRCKGKRCHHKKKHKKHQQHRNGKPHHGGEK
jgi:hypothetical protein